jgi:hypothetical protein
MLEELPMLEAVHYIPSTSLMFGCFAVCNRWTTFTLGIKHESITMPAPSCHGVRLGDAWTFKESSLRYTMTGECFHVD